VVIVVWSALPKPTGKASVNDAALFAAVTQALRSQDKPDMNAHSLHTGSQSECPWNGQIRTGIREDCKKARSTILLRAAAIALLLGTSPAVAFDTAKLGQRGTLSSDEIMPLIKQSRRLRQDFKQALAENKRDSVSCDGMRFPGQWEELGGQRVAPYACHIGSKWLIVRANVRITDRRGRVFEKITPEAMRNATNVRETSPRWEWTDPFND